MILLINQNSKGNNNEQLIDINVGRFSTILSEVLPNILKLIDTNPSPEDENACLPYGIEEKISYNNIVACRDFIEDYGSYSSAIDSIYDAAEQSMPAFKNKLFKYFKDMYREKLAKVYATALRSNAGANKQQIIQNHADEIMLAIGDEFRANLLQSSNSEKICIEEITSLTWIVICHAFVNCKIFERPPNAGR